MHFWQEYNQRVVPGYARVVATRGPDDWTIEAQEMGLTKKEAAVASNTEASCLACSTPRSKCHCSIAQEPEGPHGQEAPRVVHNVNEVEGLTIMYEAFSEGVERWLWEFCPPMHVPGYPECCRIGVNGQPYDPRSHPPQVLTRH